MLKIDILKWANSHLLLQNPEEAVKEFMEEKPIMSEMEQKIKYYQVTIATVENAIVYSIISTKTHFDFIVNTPLW